MNNLLRVLYSILPNFLKKIAKNFYRKLGSFIILDMDFVNYLSEHFRVSKKEILWLLKFGNRIDSNLWLILNPQTEEEEKIFYNTTPFYIFDLAFWHMTLAQRHFRSKIIKIVKGNVLDYGGGIGDLCLAMSKDGLRVDYADVGGRTFDFAKQMFQKKGVNNISMINLNNENISKNYDTILAIDVIEHVPNAKEVIVNLIKHLNKNGRLVVTGLRINEDSQIHPMHQKINFNKEYLISLGLLSTNEPWLFLKK